MRYQTIIEDALRRINVVAIDQPVQGEDVLIGLNAINYIFDVWSGLEIRPDDIATIVLSLPEDTASITLNGVSDLTSIFNVSGRLASSSGEGWQSIRPATLQRVQEAANTQVGFPDTYALEKRSTSTVIHFSALPTSETTVRIFGAPRFSDVTAASLEFFGRPGMVSSLVDELSWELLKRYSLDDMDNRHQRAQMIARAELTTSAPVDSNVGELKLTGQT